jgi:hypothetical protein
LTAVNSIGNNMACTTMVGGLVGEMVGINGIPKKIINGLANDKFLIPSVFNTQSAYLLDLVQTIADGANGRSRIIHIMPLVIIE